MWRPKGHLAVAVQVSGRASLMSTYAPLKPHSCPRSHTVRGTTQTTLTPCLPSVLQPPEIVRVGVCMCSVRRGCGVHSSSFGPGHNADQSH